MLILVLNAGSSSLKYQLLDMNGEQILAKGSCERIGQDNSIHKYTENNGFKTEESGKIVNHIDGIERAVAKLTDKQHGVIKSLNEVRAIGHRIAQGGSLYKEAVLISDSVKKGIRTLTPLAPLHNEAQLQVIEACMDIFGSKLPQCAVFDTAFHATMPPKSYMYALPYELYEQHGIRKYGFHGTSHRYVASQCAQMMGKPLEELKLITCHIGNGSSITAIDRGCVLDTSMGFTPLDGLMMGTRCGSIDPSISVYLMRMENYSSKQIDDLYNRKSGLLGVSGISSDDREVLAAEQGGSERAALAHQMLYYQISKLIGSYVVALKGVDAIVFTAGLGENQYQMREKVCEDLSFMGLEMDTDKNVEMVGGKSGRISTARSAVAAFVIATNEELLIARDTKTVVQKTRS